MSRTSSSNTTTLATTLTTSLSINSSSSPSSSSLLLNERNTNRHELNLMDYDLEEKQFIEDNNNEVHYLSTNQSQQGLGEGQFNIGPDFDPIPENIPSRLISLPLYLVYNILEFMVS